MLNNVERIKRPCTGCVFLGDNFMKECCTLNVRGIQTPYSIRNTIKSQMNLESNCKYNFNTSEILSLYKELCKLNVEKDRITNSCDSCAFQTHILGFEYCAIYKNNGNEVETFDIRRQNPKCDYRFTVTDIKNLIELKNI